MKKGIIIAIICAIVCTCAFLFGIIFRIRNVVVQFEQPVTVCDSKDIVDSSGIKIGSNIFSIDEKKIKERIQNAYPNNSIVVTDIVRSFPDKVTIKVKERVSLFKIEVNTGEITGYVAPDKDFQRAKIYSNSEIESIKLVNVSGFVVSNSLATKECYILKNMAETLLELGFTEKSIPFFLSSVQFDENLCNVVFYDNSMYTYSCDAIQNDFRLTVLNLL